MRLVSKRPLTCLGDSVILSKMKLQELQEGETYEDLLKLLGPYGSQVKEVLSRVEEAINKSQEKYTQAT